MEEDGETSKSKADFEYPVRSGITEGEFEELKTCISDYHTYSMAETGQCCSLLAQRVHAPLETVWSIVQKFDRPQVYKHFIKSCAFKGDRIVVGCLREVNVISGLPASTSTERLDVLDDEHHVAGFSIIGGEHRLRNYKSMTSVNEFKREGKVWCVVLESYVVDVPEGNTEEDTRMFADTVVKLNLQKLRSVAEGMAKEEKTEP
ncbi:abscisic acid receptor PYR1-like [Aristolochia californica]|uniref:abscisic acid receptor PYR1-like n=1 Tax=Aristolochia californica TaxID=171875 RepID=UPI0035DBF5FC